MAEQMNVPKLRFGEFEGKWVSQKLKSLSKTITKGTTPKRFNSGDINFIKIESLVGTKIDLNKCITIDSETHGGELKRSILQDGDILFAIAGATVGKVGVVDSAVLPANTNQALAIIRLKNAATLDFTVHVLLSRTMKKYIFQSVSVGAQPNLNLEQIGSFQFLAPTPPEQQKIASFLSKVDEKIALLSEKKDKLTEYKKGVMQQLFNGKWEEQDGQLTFVPPTLRFKADDDSEFPDWEEKKFGDCFDFFTTNSLSRDKLSYDMGMIKNIHYGDIHTKFRSIFKPEQELVPYIAELDDTKKIKPQSYCQNGDLVFADASEDYADIGKCIEVRELGNLKLVAGLHTHLARPKEKFATGYQAYLQKSWKMRYQIMRIAQGTKVLGISTKQLATIYLPVPCYEEQEKIAAFLISLDSKIECLEFELNKSKEWKRGLLQQMFV